jgi:hypothetical protein
MIRKIGLEASINTILCVFASRLRHAIITKRNITGYYYTAIYYRGKNNVLLS